jgi:AraC family transcriptional regulator of adaptative response/methylated-DNA-[protein]-cysteine methyltransferase
MDHSSDYDTVARAIRFLCADFKNQPSLDELAKHVHLSPSHFQRIFTRWAGVSPKRFLQFLTVEHAKDRLRASDPVLQAAYKVGLSGPARLHDLFISTTGVTPGEYKTLGGALEIRYGIQATPFGPALLGLAPRGLCHLAFLGENDEDGGEALSILEWSWPRATLAQAKRDTGTLAKRVFGTTPAAEDPQPLSLFLKGTNFQIKVWEALLRIPPGNLTTYGRLASAMGNAGAARAVGSAVGKNPIAFLIPCHRVIREEGTLGGYRWGTHRKQMIQGWEAARLAS